MICHKCGQQMHQKRIDGKPVGYGYAHEDNYLTVEVKECPCGNLVLEEYQAKACDLKMAKWVLKRNEQVRIEEAGRGVT